MLLRRVFPPTAAQRLVKVNQIGQPGELRLDEILLRVVKVLLRGEDVERTVHAAAEARFGQFIILPFGFDQGLVGRQLRFHRGPHRERVGNFPESGLNGFFVVGDFDQFA